MSEGDLWLYILVTGIVYITYCFAHVPRLALGASGWLGML